MTQCTAEGLEILASQALDDWGKCTMVSERVIHFLYGYYV